jgi:hypothetical protein
MSADQLELFDTTRRLLDTCLDERWRAAIAIIRAEKTSLEEREALLALVIAPRAYVREAVE